MALYLLLSGRTETYERYRSWMIQQVEENRDDFRHTWTVLKASVMAPISDHLEQEAVMRIPLRADEEWGGMKEFPPYWFALYRSGRLDEMLTHWKDMSEKDLHNSSRIPYYLAMAKWKKGEHGEATQILEGIKKRLEPNLGELSEGWPNLFTWWDGYLTNTVLLREATQMIEQNDE